MPPRAARGARALRARLRRNRVSPPLRPFASGGAERVAHAIAPASVRHRARAFYGAREDANCMERATLTGCARSVGDLMSTTRSVGDHERVVGGVARSEE